MYINCVTPLFSIRLPLRFWCHCCHCWWLNHWQSKHKSVQVMPKQQSISSKGAGASLMYTPAMFFKFSIVKSCAARLRTFCIASLQNTFLFFSKLESILCYRQIGQWRAIPAEIKAMLAMVSLLCARVQEWQQEPPSRAEYWYFYFFFYVSLIFRQPVLSWSQS